MTRPAWWMFAACTPRWADRPLDQWVNLWFPPGDYAKSPEAVAICEECPAREACLDHAIVHNEDGIRGGLTESQRRGIRRDLRAEGRLPRLCRRCGTRFHIGRDDPRGSMPQYCTDECRDAAKAEANARSSARHYLNQPA